MRRSRLLPDARTTRLPFRHARHVLQNRPDIRPARAFLFPEKPHRYERAMVDDNHQRPYLFPASSRNGF